MKLKEQEFEASKKKLMKKIASLKRKIDSRKQKSPRTHYSKSHKIIGRLK